MLLRILRNTLLFPFKLVAFLWLLFYEWGWEPLARAVQRLLRFRWMRFVERKLRYAPPWVAVSVFLMPTLLLLPVKIAALWLLAQGHKLLGISIIVAAKIFGTALVAWIFKLTQPTLMKLNWFAWIYVRVTAWRDRWLAQLRATEFYLWAHRARLAAKSAIAPIVAAVKTWLTRLRQ